MKKNLFYTLAILSLIFGLSLVSCDKNKSDIDTPAAPSEENFVMNFKDFGNGKSGTTTYINKATAVGYVGIWQTIIIYHMAIPVAAFKGTIAQAVQEVEPNHWMWSYTTSILFVDYTSELHAIYENGKIIWEMRISQENGYSNFVWFTGESDVDQTKGSWILYSSPEDPRAFLDIHWEKNIENTIGYMKYENVLEGNQAEGSYIIYGAKINEAYNRYYNIVGVEVNNYALIEWNKDQKNGRIQAPNSYGDNLWHCWNTAGADIVCE
jgi:hypothetical protein